jgi:hypothetical protein
MEVTINLTNKEKKILDRMMGKRTFEEYIKGKINARSTQELNDKWDKKSKEEKEALIPDDSD